MNVAIVFTAVFVQYVWGDLLGAKRRKMTRKKGFGIAEGKM